MIDFSKTYKTRDGRNVRNPHQNDGYFAGQFPVTAQVQHPRTGEWLSYVFTARGNATQDDLAHPLDLIEQPAQARAVEAVRCFQQLQGYSFATMALGVEDAHAAYCENFRGLF